jgi:hypothetical protein
MANSPGPQMSIGNGQTLNADVAVLWNGLAEEMHREDGIVLVATQGTRTWQEQYNLWAGYQKKMAGVAGYSNYNPAWHPDDPRANHIAGKCVDAASNVGYTSTREARQFRLRCGKWGIRLTVAGEPWHVQIERAWASAAILALIDRPTSPAATPAPIEEQDSTMHPFLIRRESDGRMALVGLPGRGFREFSQANGAAEYAEVQNFRASSGGKISIRGGVVDMPPFASLGIGTHVQNFSDVGYGEAISTFNPKA